MERLVLEVGGKPGVLYSLSEARLPLEPQRKHWRNDVVCQSLEKAPSVDDLQTKDDFKYVRVEHATAVFRSSAYHYKRVAGKPKCGWFCLEYQKELPDFFCKLLFDAAMGF